MILYAVTAILLLILDDIILTMVVMPLFIRHLGALLRYCPMLVPAGLFYLDHLAGHVFLVLASAVRNVAPGRTALAEAIVGAMALSDVRVQIHDDHAGLVVADGRHG